MAPTRSGQRRRARMGTVAVVGVAAVALAAGVSSATLLRQDDGRTDGSADGVRSSGPRPALERAAASAKADKPKFQMPAECGTRWQLNTWGHNPALDIVVKGNTGSSGKTVRASAPGKVIGTYWTDGSGNTIQISHGGGWFTAYYHLKDSASKYVKKGQKVKRYTKIGRIGTTGNSSWAHLHFEQRYAPGKSFSDESDRVSVHFNRTKYTGSGAQWKDVVSHNCTNKKPTAYEKYRVTAIDELSKRSWAGKKYKVERKLAKGATVCAATDLPKKRADGTWLRLKAAGGADDNGPWSMAKSAKTGKTYLQRIGAC